MIVIKDVHKRYRTIQGPGRWVLKGVDLTIPPKVNVGLIGHNGAGKSTLLRLICGIDQPTRGRVERHCRVSWPMRYGRGLQNALSGRQNAKFVCRIHGHENDIPERVKFIEEFSELGSAFDEPINTYSSGMRGRLQFSMSIAFDFDVYVADEVTGAGDASFREKAKTTFKNMANRSGLIIVSHAEGILKQVCSAGIWLHDGKAIWFDNVEEALKAYKQELGVQ